jgi:hypothetical protein
MAPNLLTLRDSAGLGFVDSLSFAAWSGAGAVAFVFGSSFSLAVKEDAGITALDSSAFRGQHTAGTGLVEQVATQVVHVSKSSGGAVVTSPGNRMRNGDVLLMNAVDGFTPTISGNPHPLNFNTFTADIPAAGTVAVVACAKNDPALVTVAPEHSLRHGDDVVFNSVGGMTELNWASNGNEAYTVDTEMRVTGITSANPAVVTVDDISGLANGDVVQLREVGGMPLASGMFRASKLNAHTVTVGHISSALPAVVSAPGHCRTDGDQVTLNGVGGMTEVNGVTYKVSNSQSRQVTVASISRGTTTLVTTTAPHGLSNGDRIRIDGVVGMTELNGGVYALTSTDSSTFRLKTAMATSSINSVNFASYLKGGVVTWSTFALKVRKAKTVSLSLTLFLTKTVSFPFFQPSTPS